MTQARIKGGVGELIHRSVLPSGLRIVTENVPTVRSVTIGIWVSVGSVDETVQQAGATHFLEHLLFKGTRRRSALELSSAIEEVGGDLNAFTAKEFTCYYARVLDTDLPLAIDVLSDLVTSARLDPADVDGERGVVLEEIAMRDDDPTDAVHDIASEAMWGDTPLGRPILGTVDSITTMSRDVIYDYYRDRYQAPNIVVAAAGNISHDHVVKLSQQAFMTGGFLTQDRPPTPPRLTGHAPATASGVTLVDRPTEQANIVLATGGLVRNDEQRFAMSVLNAALGGGMSSRLFQEVREKRGLAYSVYSFNHAYAAAGMFGIYAGCQPGKIDDVLESCQSILADVVRSGLTEEEFQRGKGQARGGLVLGLEDTSARMGRIAKSELVYDELLSVDQLVARIDAVRREDVQQLAESLLQAPKTLSVIGPFESADRFESLIQ